jgi:hypothetical protein
MAKKNPGLSMLSCLAILTFQVSCKEHSPEKSPESMGGNAPVMVFSASEAPIIEVNIDELMLRINNGDGKSKSIPYVNQSGGK